jgi:multimeric flavodoxin WrbA
MDSPVSRREFVGALGVGATAASLPGLAAVEAAGEKSTIKIVGLSCSPRKGKTTAQGIAICLEAAKAVDPKRIETELIDLADLDIPAYVVAKVPLKAGHRDDFPQVAETLADPKLAGIIVGSPVYFGNMTALCKAFLDRCAIFRAKAFALSGKVGGALAVGGVRNGGQELVVQSILHALMCHEMLIVGDGRPTGHWGATLWNNGTDDISQDEFGVATAKNLGRRVAEVALARFAPGSTS